MNEGTLTDELTMFKKLVEQRLKWLLQSTMDFDRSLRGRGYAEAYVG